jgi:centromere protein C
MPRDLPLAKSRKEGEGKVVGQAASAFNVLSDDSSCYVGYIMGTFTLPPRGIKDAESVGQCAQTFTVVTGQPGALEVSYGDPDLQDEVLVMANAQRFLLGPNDLFRIPSGNCYRLQNHSKHAECFLSWTMFSTSIAAAERMPYALASLQAV